MTSSSPPTLLNTVRNPCLTKLYSAAFYRVFIPEPYKNKQTNTLHCSVAQNDLNDSHWNARCVDYCTTLLKEIQVSVLITHIFKRQCDICLVHFCEFTAFEKKITLTAHHTNFNVTKRRVHINSGYPLTTICYEYYRDGSSEHMGHYNIS